MTEIDKAGGVKRVAAPGDKAAACMARSRAIAISAARNDMLRYRRAYRFASDFAAWFGLLKGAIRPLYPAPASQPFFI